jgi:UDP-N-acetylglucosamine acyltransferase
MKPHPTALVDPAATVADDVEIGPFCVVGPEVRVGPGCRLGPRVMLQGPALIGRDNMFHAHVTVGAPGGGQIEVGDGNVFRESTHVDAPKPGAATRIGSRNRFGTWVGLGAGCTVGNDVRIGSLSAVGEDCVVGDGAGIEGQCVIEEKRRIGKLSRIRSQVPVSEDVPPFMSLDGNPAEIQPPEAARG